MVSSNFFPIVSFLLSSPRLFHWVGLLQVNNKVVVAMLNGMTILCRSSSLNSLEICKMKFGGCVGKGMFLLGLKIIVEEIDGMVLDLQDQLKHKNADLAAMKNKSNNVVFLFCCFVLGLVAGKVLIQ
jgi:hypothetical protein